MARDIITLYEEQGFAAKHKTGGEFCGPCPWCGGKDRFTLFTGQGAESLGRYWCRQCGKGGDSIQFLRELHGMSFQEAKAALGLSELPGRAGPRAPQLAAKPDFVPGTIVPPGDTWQLQAGKVIFWATAQLRKSPTVQEWLQHERGLTLNTALGVGLGWIPQDYYRPRKSFGLPPEYKRNGKPRQVWIPQGLSIPVISRSGDILRVKFRVSPKVGQDRPKYIPLPQLEKCTAPLVLESRSGAAAWQVVESELDALLLSQEAGHLVNVVAMGSASYRPDAATWARLQAAPRVLLCLDFDEAGNKAACRWWERYLPQNKVKLWPVPEGKDPCDAWRAGWKLADWISEGLLK